MLEQYGHGGDLTTAAALYGRDEASFLDFSSNMNPYGPPESAKTALYAAASLLHRYPDPQVRLLRERLALYYDIEPESILIGNGAAECIELALRVLRPKRTLVAHPSFREYEEAVHKVASMPVALPLSEEDDFAVTAGALQRTLPHADAVFLGHPGNPTGQLLAQAALEQLAAWASESAERHVCLDEAFLDFVEGEARISQLRRAASDRQWLVVRSMTKFFAIPGIRLGFAVGHPDVIARMKHVQTPWSVNTAAMLIGAAVLEEVDYMARTRRWLAEEGPWLHDQLQATGLRVFPSTVNFMLAKLPDGLTASTLQRQLGMQGILIRNAGTFDGLDESYIRLAVRLRADNLRLVAAMEEGIARCKEER